MPELPEVETTCRGIEPHLSGHIIQYLTVRQPRLRWPIPETLTQYLPGKRVLRVWRRAKYLLLDIEGGTLILHLGMSGSLRILPPHTPAGSHDHFDLVFDQHCLRYRDPRRFGALIWTREPPLEHPLLAHLGPEPLGPEFTADYLQHRLAGKRPAIKTLLMDSRVVAGVGNIYANEALFMAGIHPARAAGGIQGHEYERIVSSIRQVLTKAIQQGGTTLRDFSREDGRPGYFAQQLLVYGRHDQPCPRCGGPIREKRINQRSSFFCPHCQPPAA